MSIPEVFPRPTDPLRDVLAAALNKVVLPRRGDLVSRTDWDNAAHAIIAALAQQGVTLTREPGLDGLFDVDYWTRALGSRNGSDRGMAEYVVSRIRAALASEDRT